MQKQKKTPTEEILIEVMSEPQFTRDEKRRVLDSYVPIIGLGMYCYLCDLVNLVHSLNQIYRKK